MRVIDSVPRAVHTHVVAHEKGTLGEAFYRVLRDVRVRVAVYDTLPSYAKISSPATTPISPPYVTVLPGGAGNSTPRWIAPPSAVGRVRGLAAARAAAAARAVG